MFKRHPKPSKVKALIFKVILNPNSGGGKNIRPSILLMISSFYQRYKSKKSDNSVK